MNYRLLAAALLASVAIHAQRPGSQNFPPVVNADGSVTFRIEQPNAKEVLFFSDFAGGGKMPAMQKGDKNLWSYTTPPVEEPGTYHYSFLVDGVLTPDPSSIVARDWRSFLPWVNVIEIREAGQPFLHDPNPDVPHGRLVTEQMKSAVEGRVVPILAYTPPGYETSGRSYPVIYLLHGSDGVAQQWSSDGRIEHLADNLIAQGRMPESILVSPDANIPGNSFAGFERYLVEEVMPFVESRYRIQADAASRSLVGVSRGGNQAFHAAYKRPDLFSRLGVFSINLGVLTSQTYASLSDVTKVNQQVRLFVYAGGMEDSLIPFPTVQRANDRLNELGVAHVFLPVTGDHAWHNWRKLFVDFVGRF